VVESEVVPRLLLDNRVGPLSPKLIGELQKSLSQTDLDFFLEQLLQPGHPDLELFINELMERGITPEVLYLDLLAPTARRLGQMWDDDVCDFVQVTLALGRVQQVLRSLSTITLHPTEALAGRALLSCADGEQHSLGLFIVAELFAKAGWEVVISAPVTNSLSAVDMVREEWFDVVGFSVACDNRLPVLKREIRALRAVSRNQALRIIVGGRVFDEHPGLAERLGADGAPAAQVAAETVARWRDGAS
jgi:methanogenic corrinoid protein MtbC1